MKYYLFDRNKNIRYFSTVREPVPISHKEFMVSYDCMMVGKIPYHKNERKYFSDIFRVLNEPGYHIDFKTCLRGQELYPTPKRLFIALGRVEIVVAIFRQSLYSLHCFNLLRFNVCMYVQDDNLPDSYYKQLYTNLFAVNIEPSTLTEEQSNMITLAIGLQSLDPLGLYTDDDKKQHYLNKGDFYDLLFNVGLLDMHNELNKIEIHDMESNIDYQIHMLLKDVGMLMSYFEHEQPDKYQDLFDYDALIDEVKSLLSLDDRKVEYKIILVLCTIIKKLETLLSEK